jgi:predicted RNA-binding Zn ribbon-like protein
VTGQVRFDYYDLFALTVASDFVNTYSEPAGADNLRTVDDLERFLGRYSDLSALADTEEPLDLDVGRIAELYDRALSQWAPTRADVDELRAVRQLLRAAFETARTDPGASVERLNSALTRYRALPRISMEHDDPHLHFEAAADGIVHWLTVTLLMGLVIFVCNGNAARLGVCASASCRRAFVDRSKNSQKKYCSDSCAHRESVAAYRARRRQDPPRT